MIKITQKKQGFAVIEIIIVIVVIMAISLAGYWVLNRNKSNDVSNKTTSSTKVEINSKDDLDKAADQLNSQDTKDNSAISSDQQQLNNLSQ